MRFRYYLETIRRLADVASAICNTTNAPDADATAAVTDYHEWVRNDWGKRGWETIATQKFHDVLRALLDRLAGVDLRRLSQAPGFDTALACRPHEVDSEYRELLGRGACLLLALEIDTMLYELFDALPSEYYRELEELETLLRDRWYEDPRHHLDLLRKFCRMSRKALRIAKRILDEGEDADPDDNYPKSEQICAVLNDDYYTFVKCIKLIEPRHNS